TAQVEAPAELIHIFDSSVGALNVAYYRRYLKPHTIRLISEVHEKHDVPIILFSVRASHLITELNALLTHV
ncbi:uroporphyrinogen decarboxylase family protein, partial [Staphylococcus aureus]